MIIYLSCNSAEDLKPASVKHIAFWYIHAKDENPNKSLQSQLSTIQLSGLEDRLDKVYIITTGRYHQNIKITSDDNNHRSHHKYEHVAHYDQLHGEIETYQRIQGHCHLNRKDKILFFFNRGTSIDADMINFMNSVDCFVLNPNCLDVLDRYDTCGWRLAPLPYLHYTGNYWWAQCNHINTLIDPNSPHNNQTFLKQTNKLLNPNVQHDLHIHHHQAIGTGKYFYEAWIGSSPVFNPADCLNASVDQYFMGHRYVPWLTVLKYCPNIHDKYTEDNEDIQNGTIVSYGASCGRAALLNHPSIYADVLNSDPILFQEYRNENHYSLINKRSIVWYGQEALLYNELLHELELTNSTDESLNRSFNALTYSQPKVVAFWHIYVRFNHFKSIVDEQLLMLQSSGLLDSLHEVYYFTVGLPKNKVDLSFSHSKIKHMDHFGRQGNELSTLKKLKQYCSVHIHDKVLYFHNKGSYHNSTENQNFRKALDCFVLNPHCIKALDKHDTCGWRLSPIPHVHYSGNFWWATCKHINKLIDPMSPLNNNTFQRDTTALSFINDTIRAYESCDLGLGRFFAETWVGSLPQFSPSDCLDSSFSSDYLYGYDLPLKAITEVCPNFQTNFFKVLNTYKLKSLSSTTNSTYQPMVNHHIPHFHYGHTCTVSDTITIPTKFEKSSTFLNFRDNLNQNINGTTFYKRMNQRSMLWYGAPPLLFNAFLLANNITT